MRISPDSCLALLPLLLAAAALLAACAPATRVTLLPQPGSAVEVQTGERHERLKLNQLIPLTDEHLCLE